MGRTRQVDLTHYCNYTFVRYVHLGRHIPESGWGLARRLAAPVSMGLLGRHPATSW